MNKGYTDITSLPTEKKNFRKDILVHFIRTGADLTEKLQIDILKDESNNLKKLMSEISDKLKLIYLV